jgi:hypothetical protein
LHGVRRSGYVPWCDHGEILRGEVVVTADGVERVEVSA